MFFFSRSKNFQSDRLQKFRIKSLFQLFLKVLLFLSKIFKHFQNKYFLFNLAIAATNKILLAFQTTAAHKTTTFPVLHYSTHNRNHIYKSSLSWRPAAVSLSRHLLSSWASSCLLSLRRDPGLCRCPLLLEDLLAAAEMMARPHLAALPRWDPSLAFWRTSWTSFGL